MKQSALYLLLLSFFMVSCQTLVSPYIENFGKTPTSVVEECLKENPHLSPQDCEILNCFTEPESLFAIRLITHDVISILDELGIDYVLAGATLLGPLRFGAPLPWDDDSDLHIRAEDLDPHVEAFRKAILAKGYTLEIQKGGSHFFSREVAFWQILYTESKYIEAMLTYDPAMSLKIIGRKWKSYHVSDNLPHLDIMRLKRVDGKYAAMGFLSHQTYTEDQYFPLQKMQFIDHFYKVPNKSEEIVNDWYPGNAVVRDFVMSPPHRKSCASPRFRDIRKSPNTYKFIVDYLKYVYGDLYQEPQKSIMID